MKKGPKGHKLEKNARSQEEKEYFERCKQFSEIASLIAESDPIVSEEEIRSEPEKPFLGQNEEHEYIEEAVVTASDDRKMVRNSTIHPYNGLGKLITTFIDGKTKKKTWKKGSAFLIAQNLIMTAAHNLFHIEQQNNAKVILEPNRTQFFPEPLFFNEPLMNGIQAKIVLMDQTYLETSESRLPYDWAVLQLFPHEKDPRLTNNKMLTCNFDYDFKKDSDGLIKIPGYPNELKDFATFPPRQLSYLQIQRQDQDICALYFDETVADSLSPTGQLLFYKHSITTGSGGSPLLLLDEKATPRKYSVIGVHVGTVGTKNVGVLLRSLSCVNELKQLINENQNHLKMDYTPWNFKKFKSSDIEQMAAEGEICPDYELQCQPSTENQQHEVQAVPFLRAIKLVDATDEVFTQFTQKADRTPNLQWIRSSDSNLTDQAIKQLCKNSLRFPNLRQIDLSSNQITGEGFKALLVNDNNFPNLKRIDLDNNQITCEGLKELLLNGKCFSNLQQIYLSNNQITDKGLEAILLNGISFPNLQTIMLSNNQITDEGFMALLLNCNSFPDLQKIYLDSNQITGEGLKALLLNGNSFPNLQKIWLSDNQITDEGFMTLLLNGNTFSNLQFIYLNNNRITGEGFKAQLFNGNSFPNLQYLYLNNNHITDGGFKKLALYGNSFPNLQFMNLNNNYIKDEGFKALLLNCNDFLKLK